jgi:hypothetical protein
MTPLRIVLVVLAGALSVALTELVSGAALALAPPSLDLTANFLLSVVVPSVLAVHLLMALVFWKAFEPDPVRNPAIFVLTHAGLQAFELASFNNPTGDIVAYLIIILASGFTVTSVFRRYFWCEACARLGP